MHLDVVRFELWISEVGLHCLHKVRGNVFFLVVYQAIQKIVDLHNRLVFNYFYFKIVCNLIPL